MQDILDEPHIDGRRVPVLTIVERVEGSGLTPRTVADRHDLDISEVYAALLYYHDHSEEFEDLRREREQIMADVEGGHDLLPLAPQVLELFGVVVIV